MGLWGWLLANLRRKSPPVVQTPIAVATTVPHTDPVMAEFGSFLLDHAPLIRRALLPVDREPIQPRDADLPLFSPRYRTLRRIGTGGMGEVYEAYDTACHRQVAIKVCRPGRSDEEDRLNASLLASEPQRLGQLEHPNIVRVYEPGYLPDGRPWYAMELVEGIAVSDYADRQNLSPRQRVILMGAVAHAVGWMHRRGLMHLDLKPGNILVTADGTPKILDFGLACPITGFASERHCAGTSREPISLGGGTPGYRAPEIPARQPVSYGTDVYSLGVILYQLLCGTLPAETAVSASDSAGSMWVARSHADHRLSRSLAAVVTKCFAQRPQDRYIDAHALADDLGRWRRWEPVRALTGLHPLYRSTLFAVRHRISTALAFLLIAFTGAAMLVAAQSRDANESAQREQFHRARADAHQQTVARERQRVETERFRIAFTAAREFCEQRRFDDAKRSLESVPHSRGSIECDLVRRQIADQPAPRTVIGSHDWGVVALLAGETSMVSAGHDGRLLVWDRSRQGPRTLLEGRWSKPNRQWRHVMDASTERPYPDAIVGLAWIRPNEVFVSASLSGIGRSWEVADGSSSILVQHDRPLMCVAASHDTIAFGDDRGSLLCCDRDGKNLRQFEFEGGTVTSLTTVTDQDGWWMGQESGTVRMVDSTGTEFCRDQFAGPIWQLARGIDSEHVLVAFGEPVATLCVADTTTHSLRRTQRFQLPAAEHAKARACHGASFSKDNKQVFVADNLGRLCCFDVGDGRLVFARDDQGEAPLSTSDVAHWPLPLRRRNHLVLGMDGETLFTAGADTLIKAWSLTSRVSSTTIHAEYPGAFQFDGENPSLLWIVRDDGRLSTFQADSGAECATVDTGESLRFLAACPKRSLVAVASDHSISCWRFRGDHIEATGTKWRCDHRPVCMAFSPDGSRLASYSVDGVVSLWELPAARLVGQRQVPRLAAEQKSTQQLAFDFSGTRIAVLGNLQTVLILDARDLSVVAQPNLVAGKGGTALAWHSTDEGVLFAGDTIGRVARLPLMILGDLPQVWTDHSPVAGLVVTPDGRRVVAATQPGKLVVIDPDFGPLYAESMSKPGVPLSRVALNSTGRLLALGYADGSVGVTRLADAEPPKPKQARRWTDTVLVQGTEAALIRLHPESVAIDELGHLHALYLKATVRPVGAASGWRLVRGHETQSGWHEVTLAEFGPLSQRATDDIERSLFLHIAGDRWHGLAKLRPLKDGEHVGDLYRLAGEIAGESVTSRDLVVAGIRAGYDPVILGQHDAPTVLHFSHAGNHLLASRRSATGWSTAPLGRQGDGYRLHAVAPDERNLHVLFRPTRFNGDRSSPLCLTVQLADAPERPLAVTRREVVESVYNPAVYGLGATTAGDPIVIIKSATNDAHQQLSLARRDADGWHNRYIIDRLPLPWHVSNLLSQPDGTVAFAATVKATGEVWLVFVPPEGKTRIEPVWRDPQPLEPVEPYMVALRDAGSGPVVLIARGNQEFGYLRVCRPQSTLAMRHDH